MATIRPHFPGGPNFPTFEEPEVARFLVVPGSDAGFLLPGGDPPVGDLHIQGLHAPGVVPGMPAVLFFRTQYIAGTTFTVRLNASFEFQFRADEARAQSWHEIIGPGVLRAQDNELVLAVDRDGQVVFSEIAILYTSNKLTVTKEIVIALDPTPD